ncbi:MAG: M48 family metallopeptidase [Nanoarchaeota archaeon]
MGDTMRVSEYRTQTTAFEYVYATFMLIFGIGFILALIWAILLLTLQLHFIILILASPLIVGIWHGIFQESNKPYKAKVHRKDLKRIQGIITEITDATDMKKPHRIIITEGSEVAVTGLIRKTIIIGLAALKYMEDQELKAILAHEYGHFAHKDTVIGYFVYKIQRFFTTQEEVNRANMRPNYWIVLVIPTWFLFWILSNYYWLSGLWHSRSKEYRADSFAAKLVGEQTFANALTKYCVVMAIFDDVLPRHVVGLLQEEKYIVNVYDYMGQFMTSKNIDDVFDIVMQARSSYKDTHPSTSERLEALGIDEVQIEINEKFKNTLLNHKKYEEEASKFIADKWNIIRNWNILANLHSAQKEVAEDDGVIDEEGYAYVCTRCNTLVAEDDIRCSNCNILLGRDGACERRQVR